VETSNPIRIVERLLRFLTEIGFLSKERGFTVANTYHLHLPPRRQR
jgi:hypothetical protein